MTAEFSDASNTFISFHKLYITPSQLSAKGQYLKAIKPSIFYSSQNKILSSGIKIFKHWKPSASSNKCSIFKQEFFSNGVDSVIFHTVYKIIYSIAWNTFYMHVAKDCTHMILHHVCLTKGQRSS